MKLSCRWRSNHGLFEYQAIVTGGQVVLDEAAIAI